jgi:hypothetical protein
MVGLHKIEYHVQIINLCCCWHSVILFQATQVATFLALVLTITNMSTTDERCGGCSRIVSARHQALECDICSKWWHRRCTSVSAKSYLAAVKSNGNLEFTCNICKEKEVRHYHLLLLLRIATNCKLHEIITMSISLHEMMHTCLLISFWACVICVDTDIWL